MLFFLLGRKAERKHGGKDAWAHRAQTLCHNFLSSPGLQDTSLMPSHYLPLCPWYHPYVLLKVRNNKKYFLAPKDNELCKSLLVWMRDRGCVVFSFAAPNLSRSHEEGVKTKVTAFEISEQSEHQHLHLAPLCTCSGNLWCKHHPGGASPTMKWDNCVTTSGIRLLRIKQHTEEYMMPKFKADRNLNIKSNQFHSLGVFRYQMYHVLPAGFLMAFKCN